MSQTTPQAEPKPKTLRYDLPIGTRFLDSRGTVWIVKDDCYISQHSGLRFGKTLAQRVYGDAWPETVTFTKATGKYGDTRIVSTDPAVIDQHIANRETVRQAAEQESRRQRAEEDRLQAEHDSTPIHNLAERIANTKSVEWSWCNGWELLGMELLREVEKKLIQEGKLK